MSTDKNFKTLKAEDFGGEYSKRNVFFIMVLWIVSALALITNLIEIFFIKAFKKRKEPIKKLLIFFSKYKILGKKDEKLFIPRCHLFCSQFLIAN